ncbi:MAG: hypothetical protein QOD77_2113 [Thermoplasmata archaeon]|jgi:hypothetical protein|nr:hypothetical protein [Thermoplasmata archaeon]
MGASLAGGIVVLTGGPGEGLLWLGGLALGLGLLGAVLAHGQFTDGGAWGRLTVRWVPLVAAVFAVGGVAMLIATGAEGLHFVLLLYLAGLAAAGLLGAIAGFRGWSGPFGRLALRWRANAMVLACLLFVGLHPQVPEVPPTLQLDLLALAFAALSLAWFWAREELLHGRPIESGLVRTHAQTVAPVAEPGAKEAARILQRHLATGQAASQYADVLRVLAVRNAAKVGDPLELPAQQASMPLARLHAAAALRAVGWAALAAAGAALGDPAFSVATAALVLGVAFPAATRSLLGPGHPMGPLPWAVATLGVAGATLPLALPLGPWGLALPAVAALPFAATAVRAALARATPWPAAAQLERAEQLQRRWVVALGFGMLLAFAGAAAPMSTDTLRRTLDEPALEIPLFVPLALAAAGLLRIGAAALAGPGNRPHLALLQRLAKADATRRRTHHARILSRLETAL